MTSYMLACYSSIEFLVSRCFPANSGQKYSEICVTSALYVTINSASFMSSKHIIDCIACYHFLI